MRMRTCSGHNNAKVTAVLLSKMDRRVKSSGTRKRTLIDRETEESKEGEIGEGKEEGVVMCVRLWAKEKIRNRVQKMWVNIE